MEIVLDILLVIVGVVFVLWGADRLTEGSVSMASKLGVSQMVIGLTIVALGTSMPEFCVSFVSALKGTADMAVGNVVGSNVFNAMLIVGVAAMVAPMCVMRQTVRKDLVFAVAASVIMGALVFDNEISRADAVILTALFIVYMWITLKGARAGHSDDLGNTVQSGAPLFPRIDMKKELEELEKLNPAGSQGEEEPRAEKPEEKKPEENKPIIDYEDFAKLDLRLAKVIACEPVKKSSHLLNLTLQVGEETRTVLSGIKDYYTPDELIGKTVVIVANLKPRKMCGIESNGMILCASDEGDAHLTALTTMTEFESGAKVR